MIKIKDLNKFIDRIKREDLKLGSFLFVGSLILVFVQLIYLNFRFDLLLEQIPLFYSRLWGDSQIVPKENIFIIPAISLFISFFGLLFFYYLSIKFYRFGTKLITFVVLSCNVFLTYSLFRITNISLKVTEPLIPGVYIQLILLFTLSLIICLIFAPWYTKLMGSLGIVTDPDKHDHPAMILEHVSARGGGLFFTALLILLSLLLVPLTTKIIGVLFITFVLAVLGFLDDYQNTHPDSKLCFLENPMLRLGLLMFFVSLLYFFDVKIFFLPNPVDGVFRLDLLNFSIGSIFIQPIAWFFTTIWIVWILNLLSWSNGVDGQYSGIVGIALIFLALLGIRYENITSIQMGYSHMAIIAAGISFGLVGVTWFPSKLMWGFGAISAGVVVAAVSILTQAKVITSILILLVPFLDAFVTLIRRIIQGKNPFKGDRGHLHHLLIDQGLSVPQIALFYWFVTLLFGGLSLFSAERPFIQSILMGIGIVFFAIALVNLKLPEKKEPLSEAEK